MESANELDFSLILLKTTRSVLVSFDLFRSSLSVTSTVQLFGRERHLVRWEPCLLLLSAFGDPEEAL